MITRLEFLLCLALVLGGGRGFVHAGQGAIPALTNSGPGFDALLSAAFPGIDLNNWGAILYHIDFRRLPAGQRNQIAVAAARELSLRTINGDMITKETVDELAIKPASNNTPAESALLRLNSRNWALVELLRNMENQVLRPDQSVTPVPVEVILQKTEYQYLVSDSGVIGPLIEMLDYPGAKTSIRDNAGQVLVLLTKRGWSPDYWNWDDRNHGKYVAWWRAWWAKNHDKHPVFDIEMADWTKARLSTIASQLRNGLHDYSEMSWGLVPENIEASSEEYREGIFNITVDSAALQQGIFRRMPDGNIRAGKEDDYIYLLISVKFATPPPYPRQDAATIPSSRTPKVEVWREMLPGTDILITIQVAAKDKTFLRQLHASLSKLPPTPDSVAIAKQQLASANNADRK